jgi:hypothetical protein
MPTPDAVEQARAARILELEHEMRNFASQQPRSQAERDEIAMRVREYEDAIARVRSGGKG